MVSSPRPIRVAYLCEYPTLLGGERSLLAFLDQSANQIDPVIVAPPSGRLADALSHQSLPHLPADHLRLDPQSLVGLSQQLAAHHPQIIHANSLSMRVPAIELASQLGIPSVVHVRDIYRLSASQWRILQKATALIAVSPAVGSFLAAGGIPPNQVHTIPNGINHNTPQKSSLALPGPPPHVACIGQMALRKGQDLFAQAAHIISQTGTNATFLLIGERYSTKNESITLESQIHSTTSSMQRAGRWFHLGYRDDVRAILPHLALVVVPSRQEPLSRVAIEALSAGVPVVATDVGGNSFILDEGRGGYLTKPNPEAIAQAIVEVLSNLAKATGVARVGQERARDIFSITRHTQRVIDLYRSILPKEIG